MMIRFLNVSLILSFLVTKLAFAGDLATPYQVATWRGFCKATLSFTFDDGSPNQFSKAMPIFDELGFEMTFFIVTGSNWGWPADWHTLKNVAAKGHEVASHTVTHGNLSQMDLQQQISELRDSKEKIEREIAGVRCISVAYPYCVAGNDSVCASHYLAARICSNVIEPSTPLDFMAISSFICGPEGPIKDASDFIEKAKAAKNTNGWVVYLIHGVDDDGGWSSISSGMLRSVLEALDTLRDEFWVATFGNAARYIRERNAATISETSVTDTSFIFELTDDLDDEIFDYPLTIRREIPSEWSSALVFQNGKQLDSRIVEMVDQKYVQFDAIPDAGEIEIRKNSTLSSMQGFHALPLQNGLITNFPNPFNNTTTLRFTLPEAGRYTLKIWDAAGQLVENMGEKMYRSGTHQVIINDDGLSSGVYFCSVQGDHFNLKGKIVLLK